MMGKLPLRSRNSGVSLVSPLASLVEASPESHRWWKTHRRRMQPENAMVSSRSVARSSARVLFFMIVPPKNVVRCCFHAFLCSKRLQKYAGLRAGTSLPSVGRAKRVSLFIQKDLALDSADHDALGKVLLYEGVDDDKREAARVTTTYFNWLASLARSAISAPEVVLLA